jgi:hypothetical protein
MRKISLATALILSALAVPVAPVSAQDSCSCSGTGGIPLGPAIAGDFCGDGSMCFGAPCQNSDWTCSCVTSLSGFSPGPDWATASVVCGQGLLPH